MHTINSIVSIRFGLDAYIRPDHSVPELEVDLIRAAAGGLSNGLQECRGLCIVQSLDLLGQIVGYIGQLNSNRSAGISSLQFGGYSSTEKDSNFPEELSGK